MKLLQQTKTQEHLINIEKCITKTNRLISTTIDNVNQGYSYLWNLPDNELQDVLQQLLIDGKLQELFINHYNTAVGLNKIQDDTGAGGNRAIIVAGREFEVSQEGDLKVIPRSALENFPIEEEIPLIIE